MSIKQTGPRTFALRVQWRDPKTGGKRSRTEVFEGTERAARAKLAALRSEAKEIGSRPQRQRLAAFARSWMLLRAPRLKPSVLVRYAGALDGHILPALGDHYIDKLERSDVQAYVAARTASGAQGHTVLNELRLLRTMAREAHADGLCARNWADRVTPPTVRKWTEERPNLLTAKQLGSLLAAVPRRWLALVTLSAFTGLRWGEVSALRWSDVDREAGAIRVRRSNWRGRIVETKTAGSKRTVPLPRPVADLLERGRPGKDSLLFPNRAGELHKGHPLIKVMQRSCKAASVPYTTPHGLRRTFNNLARQVAAAQIVKSITGHTTDAMMEHYSIVGLEEKTEAASLVMALVSASVTATLPDGQDSGAGVEHEGDGE